MNKIANEQSKSYIKRLAEFRRLHYILPVLKIIAILPKSELAAMAETFVNLTSFKRKISFRLW